MTREEKLQLNRDRQKAVRDAWNREKGLVEQGKGTVDWSVNQQRELLETGRVKGYEGQHMKSCCEYPEYASLVDNIQLLTHEEHFEAHNSVAGKGYHSPTNGFYNTTTKKIQSFGNNPPQPPKVIELSETYSLKNSNNAYRENDLAKESVREITYNKSSNELMNRWR